MRTPSANGLYSRSVSSPPTITPLFVADLLAEGERMPVYAHVIDHRVHDHDAEAHGRERSDAAVPQRGHARAQSDDTEPE